MQKHMIITLNKIRSQTIINENLWDAFMENNLPAETLAWLPSSLFPILSFYHSTNPYPSLNLGPKAL